MTWFIAYMIAHPEVQSRLQKELDAKIGGERVITNADRSELPYLAAVINEVFRHANPIGQNIPRKLGRDVTIAGTFIPKGVTIIPQIR